MTVCVAATLLAGCTGSAHTDSPPTSGSAPTSADASTTATPASLGGQIAFAHDGTRDPKHEQIYLIRADGSNFRQLVHSEASDLDPVLSPDGRRVVFTRHVEATPDRIFVVNVDGSKLKQLVASNCPDVCGDAVEGSGWSPDGRTLAFTRAVFHGHSRAPDTIEIWLMDVGNGAARRVTRGYAGTAGDMSAQDNFASWSPDGSLIAFQSPPDEEGITKSLYTIRPDGTGMISVTNRLGDDNNCDHPTWSPDSRTVAFSHARAGSATGADLYVVNRDGSQPRPIAETLLNESAPSWGIEPS